MHLVREFRYVCEYVRGGCAGVCKCVYVRERYVQVCVCACM